MSHYYITGETLAKVIKFNKIRKLIYTDTANKILDILSKDDCQKCYSVEIKCDQILFYEITEYHENKFISSADETMSVFTENTFKFAEAADNEDMFSITGELLNHALKAFSDLVEKKSASRIPYSTWRDLSKFTNKEQLVIFLNKESKDTSYYIFDGVQFVELHNIPYSFINIIEQLSDYPDDVIPFLSCETQSNQSVITTTNTNTKKEKNTMNMPSMNFDFGPASKDIAISPYGLAIRNPNGTWLTYNATSNQTVDVTGFTFDFGNMIYKMPVAITGLAIGDMIIHQKRPMFVTKIEGNTIEAVDILASEAKTVIPVTNMFGFNFVTKIISLVNLGGTSPSPDQPFGNIMPMMMMSALFGDDNDFGDMDFSKLMMISMMSGGANPLSNLFNFGNLAESV